MVRIPGMSSSPKRLRRQDERKSEKEKKTQEINKKVNNFIKKGYSKEKAKFLADSNVHKDKTETKRLYGEDYNVTTYKNEKTGKTQEVYEKVNYAPLKHDDDQNKEIQARVEHPEDAQRYAPTEEQKKHIDGKFPGYSAKFDYPKTQRGADKLIQQGYLPGRNDTLQWYLEKNKNNLEELGFKRHPSSNHLVMRELYNKGGVIVIPDGDVSKAFLKEVHYATSGRPVKDNEVFNRALNDYFVAFTFIDKAIDKKTDEFADLLLERHHPEEGKKKWLDTLMRKHFKSPPGKNPIPKDWTKQELKDFLKKQFTNVVLDPRRECIRVYMKVDPNSDLALTDMGKGIYINLEQKGETEEIFNAWKRHHLSGSKTDPKTGKPVLDWDKPFKPASVPDADEGDGEEPLKPKQYKEKSD